jgi:hypothetical protein
MSHRKAPQVRNDAPGMRGERSRNEDGALRQKRGDTHASTVEEMYHVDLAVRGDKKLSTENGALGVREMAGTSGLSPNCPSSPSEPRSNRPKRLPSNSAPVLDPVGPSRLE